MVLHVRLTFWYISLPSLAKQQREMTKFYVFSGTWAHDGKVLFLFSYFTAVHSNLVPGQFASILQVKQISIIAKEIRKREVIFWNDIFVTVTVVAAKAPKHHWLKEEAYACCTCDTHFSTYFCGTLHNNDVKSPIFDDNASVQMGIFHSLFLL